MKLDVKLKIHNPFDEVWRFSTIRDNARFVSDRKTLFNVLDHLQSWYSLDDAPLYVVLTAIKDALLRGDVTIKMGYNDYRIYVDDNSIEVDDKLKKSTPLPA